MINNNENKGMSYEDCIKWLLFNIDQMLQCVRVSYDQYDIIQFNLRTFESIGIVMMGRSKKLKYSATREIYVYKRARINNKYRT